MLQCGVHFRDGAFASRAVGACLIVGLGACRTGRAALPAPPLAAAPSARASKAHAPAAAPSAPAASTLQPADRPAPRWPPRTPPHAASDWCITALPALDAESCYVLPATPTHTLLIYLVGVVPPSKTSPQKTRVEQIVRAAAKRAHVAALVPRGKQGLAPKGLHGWWGWPSSEYEYRKDATALVARILSEKRELEQSAGVSFSRTYLAGSSSGAYFTALLALHGGLQAAGFGIFSGGAGRRTRELQTLLARPVYIGFGTEDSVGGAARRLARVFRSAGWPVEIAAHHVSHGARPVYLNEAFAFWDKQADGGR